MNELVQLNLMYIPYEHILALPVSGWVKVCQVNILRWSIAFAVQQGIGSGYLVSTQNQDLNLGFTIPAGGAPLTFTARDYPGTIGGEWWVQSIGGFASVACVLETNLRPEYA
jgi:hypothetical protein